MFGIKPNKRVLCLSLGGNNNIESWERNELFQINFILMRTLRSGDYLNNSVAFLPFGLNLGGIPVSLSSVFKPVADLRQGESCNLGEVSFLGGRGVPILIIQILQRVPRPLLETIHRLLAVPDSPRERVLSPDPVLVHGAQGSTPRLLRLGVAGFVPEILQEGVVGRTETVVLQNTVQLLVAGLVERDERLRFQDALVAAEQVALWQ